MNALVDCDVDELDVLELSKGLFDLLDLVVCDCFMLAVGDAVSVEDDILGEEAIASLELVKRPFHNGSQGVYCFLLHLAHGLGLGHVA